MIACHYRDDPNDGPRLAIIPSEGGQPIKLFDARRSNAETVSGAFNGHLMGKPLPTSRQLGDVSNIWSQPLNGDPPKPLTDFKSDSIFSFSWSRDGKQLVYSRGAVTSDVVLIRDSK